MLPIRMRYGAHKAGSSHGGGNDRTPPPGRAAPSITIDCPSRVKYRSATSCPLPKTVSESLVALSRQERVTLFMTLLAAFKVLRHRYTGQDDIVVGSPIANRNCAQVANLVESAHHSGRGFRDVGAPWHMNRHHRRQQSSQDLNHQAILMPVLYTTSILPAFHLSRHKPVFPAGFQVFHLFRQQ